MARRNAGNMSGERYLANKDPRTKEVHDLDHEKCDEDECMIDEIIATGLDDPFETPQAARFAGYKYCKHCIGDQPKK